MSALFERNLAYLRSRISGTTRSALTAPVPDAATLEVDGRGELPVFRARINGNAPVALHSPRRPHEEARRQVERWAADHHLRPGALIVCLGVGGGFHLAPLAQQVPENGCLLVIDPHPGAVRVALDYMDLSWLQDDIDFRLVTNHDLEVIYGEFLSLLQRRPRMDYSFFSHPGVLRVFSASYAPLPRRLGERIRVDLVQRSTLFNLSRSWIDNALTNIPLLLDSTPVDRLRDVFAGVPAAVIAAGPSLEACLPLIRALRSRMAVIAVGTAVRPLLAAGIPPDLAVVVDASPLVLRQFDGVEPHTLRLLAPAQIEPRLLQRFADRLISFGTSALPAFDEWMERLGAPVHRLRAGGTVTITAIDAALFLGCAEILVFGFDLAFRDDGITHAAHSIWEEARHDPDSLIAVPGNTRAEVRTSRQFAAYIEVAAGYLAQIRREGAPPVVNVTTDGARIPNAVHRPPSAIDPEQWPLRDGLRQVLDNRLAGERRGDRKATRQALYDIRKQLSTSSRAAERAVRLCRRAADAAGSAPGEDDELRRCEKTLTRKNRAAPLLNDALRAESMHTLSVFAGFGSDDERQFTAVHAQCAQFYQAMADTARWLQQRLRSVQEDLPQVPRSHPQEHRPS